MRRILALILLAVTARAAADIAHGSPNFHWTTPPAGATEVWVYCNSTIKIKLAMPISGWQSSTTDFLAEAQTCYVQAMANGVATGAPTNNVSFTVPTIVPGTPVLSAAASGNKVTLQWTLPAVTQAPLAETRIVIDGGPPNPGNYAAFPVPTTTWAITSNDLPVGPHTATAYTVDKSNAIGGASNTVNFVVAAPTPTFVLTVE